MKDRPVLRWGLNAIYLAALALTAVGAMLIRINQADYDDWGEAVAGAADFFRQHSWVIALMPAIAAAAKWASEHLTRSWLLKIVQSLLTDYCDEVFSGKLGVSGH